MAKLKDGTRIYGDAQVDQTLTVGNITISGSLTVQGTTTTIDTTTTRVQDPIFELGGGANGVALSTNDGKERGILMHYWNGSADTTSYMGWHTSNAQFEFGAVATETSGNISVGTYGNVKAFHYYGEGDTLANITGANVTGWVNNANYANFAGTVLTNAQPNITSTGTLTGLDVSGTSNLATVNANGITTLSNATTSTSTTSGALVITGGAGIGGNLYVGGTLYANISGTTSAPGADTNIVFNDNGTSNATAGFTFNKTTNTVSTTALVLSGAANVGTDINMTNAAASIKGTTLTANASTELNLVGSSANAKFDTSGVVIKSSGGNVTLNNSGDFSVSTGNLTLPNANISSSGTANFGGALNVTNTATVANIIANNFSEYQIAYSDGTKKLVGDNNFSYTSGTLAVGAANLTGALVAANVTSNNLTATRVTYAGTNGKLVDDSAFTFAAGTLSVGNATLAGNVQAANVIVTSLTSTRVPFVHSDDSLIDDSTFTFASGKLSVGNIDLTGALVAANVTSNNLTSGRVALAGTAGKLEDSTNLTFNGTVLTVTGNVAATNIKTDNLLYANGTAWDLQQADGSNGDIQFNLNDNFTSSANLNFNTTGNVLTTDGLVLNANANVGNATVRSLTSGRVTLAGTNGLLTDSSSLTFASSNLTVNGNIITGGGSGGNISGVNYLFANIANVIDVNASGNANIVGTLKAGDTTIAGNLTVTGTTTSVNTTVSQLTDPLFDLGNGANGAALASDDGMDRGLVMHIYEGATQDLFMGWDNSASEFVLAKNVTVANNVVTVNGANAAEVAANLADLRLSNIFALNANFGGVVFSNGNVTLGAGSSFNGNVNGNISGNITVSGGNGAIQFSNAGNTLTSDANLNFDSGTDTLTVGNTVSATLFTGTLTTAAQPNVTSLGTLTGLAIDGNLSIGNAVGTNGIKTDNLYYSNGVAWDLQQASGSNTEIQFNTGNNFASSSKFTFNPTGNIFTVDGDANITGKIETSNVFVSTLTATRVTFAGASGRLVDDSAFTFGSGKLSVGNVDVTSAVVAANVTSNNLSNTRVTFAGADGKLVDNGNLTFTGGNVLTVTGTANVSGTLNAGNVTVSSLTGGRVVFSATADDSLVDSANLTFNTASDTLTTVTANVTTLNSGNIVNTGNITSGNLYANSGTVGATYVTGTLTTAAQPNVTSVGTLTSLTVSGTTNLGAVGNVTITGGTAGQYLKATNGSGGLEYASLDTSIIANGTSNVSIPTVNGNVNVVSAGNTVIEVSGTGANVTGIVGVTGNITANNITSTNFITANSTTDATSAATGAIKTEGGISAKGNIYAGKAVGFAVGGGNTVSAAYIQYNSTSGSLDFIFN